MTPQRWVSSGYGWTSVWCCSELLPRISCVTEETACKWVPWTAGTPINKTVSYRVGREEKKRKELEAYSLNISSASTGILTPLHPLSLATRFLPQPSSPVSPYHDFFLSPSLALHCIATAAHCRAKCLPNKSKWTKCKDKGRVALVCCRWTNVGLAKYIVLQHGNFVAIDVHILPLLTLNLPKQNRQMCAFSALILEWNLHTE